MQTRYVDALVVGSGFGGAAPALRLAQAGFRVDVIEKGPHVDASVFRQTQDPQYFRNYLKSLSAPALNLTYAEALGGGSGFYEMVSLRAPTCAFDQVDGRGRRLWPVGVDRSALDPYYDRAEAVLGVEQIPVSDVPKTGLVFSLLMKNLGYSCDRARYAVRGCVGSGYCVAGCVYGAKQSLFLNYLPQAEREGARVETDLEARSIRTLVEVRNSPRAGALESVPHRYEVVCRKGRGEDEGVRYRARIVVLAAGTTGSARLLQRSREHLPFLSDHLGRNIAFNGSVKVAALLPDGFPDADMYSGRSHPGMVSYEFLESHRVMVTAVKALPLQLVAGARVRIPGAGDEADFGAAHVELMRSFRKRVIVLAAFGLTPPAGRLDPSGQVGLTLDAGLRAYHRRTSELLGSILVRNGCRLLDVEFLDSQGRPFRDLHFSTTHHVGSCRMADSKDRGVVDAYGEAFDYPGLYVTDGAAIPTSLAVNTSLTILANAERVADHIARAFHAAPAPARSRITLDLPRWELPSAHERTNS